MHFSFFSLSGCWTQKIRLIPKNETEYAIPLISSSFRHDSRDFPNFRVRFLADWFFISMKIHRNPRFASFKDCLNWSTKRSIDRILTRIYPKFLSSHHSIRRDLHRVSWCTACRHKRLQTALNLKLGKLLNVDGHFGPATATAFIEFQKANGLTPNSLVQPKTIAKLGIWWGNTSLKDPR